jgi:F-type H+-transporting ATPase subunit epsilon
MVKFELVTLDGVKFGEEVAEVILPTLDGYIGVLTNHMPLISVATNGVISIRRNPGDPDDMMDHYATAGGVIEVAENTIRMLVDAADHADEISEDEARRAYELAQKMKAEAKDEVSLEKAQAMVDRSAVRLQVAGLRRNRRTKR